MKPSIDDVKYSLLRTITFMLLVPGFVATIPGGKSWVSKGSQVITKPMLVHALVFFILDILATMYL